MIWPRIPSKTAMVPTIGKPARTVKTSTRDRPWPSWFVAECRCHALLHSSSSSLSATLGGGGGLLRSS
uniref:Uncharacterized protein n=1 Tax=Arundo donax TaxID=35708 RepID=A0A0A9GN92_ARUDO